MRKETRDQWVADLRSGKYEQHRGNMTKNCKGSYADAFCCLGVLYYKTLNEDNRHEYDEIALSNVYNVNLSVSLIHKNDIEKKSFLEIADWIEQNVPIT